VDGVPPPAWLDELTFAAGGPPWLAMGVSRLDLADWLRPDERRDEELAERRRLLADRHDEVFGARPGTEAAGTEALALVRSWLVEHRPDLAATIPDDRPAVHPLESAGRLVQEDLCLMVPRNGAYHLDAACLCFPSHWRLADKLGGPAVAIHGPVPGYEADLARRVDRYLARLRPESPGWRRNWSVHASPALFAPMAPEHPRLVTVEQVATGLWLRSERQTLRRLPESGVVLFTIRVQQARFGVLAQRPDVATAFAARLRAQPPALTAMNGLSPHLPAVLAWLDGCRKD
jgi:dimethylamine monooxygenase subunit A